MRRTVAGADAPGVTRRIYLCDDAADYRRLLREVFAGEADLEVVGEGANGRECIENIARERPDVILLDINMPVMDGFAALPCLRKIAPDADVLVLSTAATPELEERALELGAVGYVQKPVDVFELPGTLRAKAPKLDRRSTGA